MKLARAKWTGPDLPAYLIKPLIANLIFHSIKYEPVVEM